MSVTTLKPRERIASTLPRNKKWLDTAPIGWSRNVYAYRSMPIGLASVRDAYRRTRWAKALNRKMAERGDDAPRLKGFRESLWPSLINLTVNYITTLYLWSAKSLVDTLFIFKNYFSIQYARKQDAGKKMSATCTSLVLSGCVCLYSSKWLEDTWGSWFADLVSVLNTVFKTL
jgi:hypothetical protein